MSNTEQNNSKEETKSDDAEVSEAIVTGKVPPAYGSKEYWDQRYEKLLVADHDDDDNNNGDGSQQAVELNGSKTSDEEASKSSVNDNDDDPVAFHSWYFSYDDLKPIILPLILGGKEEVERLLGDTEEKDGDGNDNDDNNANKSVNETESPPPMLKTSSKSGKQDSSADEDGSDNSDAGEDGWEEVAGNESVDSEEGEAEISQTEAGLVIESPVAVLEVGCGDVPLVLGLADDLGKLEAPSSKTTKPIVNRIVCTDYSATLIRTLERIHQKKRKLPGTSNAGDGGTVSALKASAESTSGETSKPTIEYMVADARELPFPDKSFHLILEKGTMDAMISDSEVGVSNCIGIVSDCARVLATGGCFFLVSHINAHTSKGEEWLEDVVLAGLRQGGSDASWNIEVHGNDHGGGNGENDDDSGDPPEAAGPAVYLIFKGEPLPETKDSSDQPAIPLKFFCY